MNRPGNPPVARVRALPDYRLDVVFENGERRLFDVRPYLGAPVFARLRNEAVFAAVRVVAGCVEWPGEVDLSNDTLYVEGRPLPAGPAATTPAEP